MFDGEQWTTPRKVIAATPISWFVAIGAILVLYPFGDVGFYLALPFAFVSGLLHLACLFMFYSDAKHTQARVGKKPRWWAYTLGAFLVSSYFIAPIYLLIWRGT